MHGLQAAGLAGVRVRDGMAAALAALRCTVGLLAMLPGAEAEWEDGTGVALLWRFCTGVCA